MTNSTDGPEISRGKARVTEVHPDRVIVETLGGDVWRAGIKFHAQMPDGEPPTIGRIVTIVMRAFVFIVDDEPEGGRG